MTSHKPRSPSLSSFAPAPAFPQMVRALSTENISKPAPPPENTAVSANENDVVESTELTGKALYLAFAGMMMATFLIALDITILGPVLPVLLSRFNALDSLIWISAGYSLTQAAFVATVGQLNQIYTPKSIFIVSIILFEIGSTICGGAVNIEMLIFGRCLAGAGAAGIQVSNVTLISEILPLAKRAAYMGAFGAVFGISSVIGPILGGAFSSIGREGWRICFLLNLPFGAIALATIWFFVRSGISQAVKRGDTRSGLQRAKSVDWVGTILVLGLVICLTLATTDGPEKGWNKPSTIICLAITGALVPAIAVWEWWLGENAMIEVSLFKGNRSYVCLCLMVFAASWLMLVPTTYYPLWSQAARGSSPVSSGLELLPLVMSLVVVSVLVGFIVKKIGRYTPFLFFGPTLCAISGGLLYTIRDHTKFANIIGYLLLLGIGVGSFFQLGNLGAQAEFRKTPHLISKAMGFTAFTQTLGSVVGLAVAGSIFNDKLSAGLHEHAPSVDLEVAKAPTTLRETLSGADLAGVITAYTNACKWVYVTFIALSVFALICAVFVKNINLLEKTDSEDVETGTKSGMATPTKETDN